MIKAIIFDVGGVLVVDPSDDRYREFSKLCSDEPQKLEKKLRKITHLYQEGKLSSGDFWSDCERKLGIDRKLVRKIWIGRLNKTKEKEKIFRLARKLKNDGYIIGILSNTVRGDMAIYKRKKRFLIFKPNIFLSFKIGYRKPSKKIYRFLLNKLRLKSSEVVFIDDMKKFSDGAKRVGIVGLHFVSYEKLVRDLKKLKVL